MTQPGQLRKRGRPETKSKHKPLLSFTVLLVTDHDDPPSKSSVYLSTSADPGRMSVPAKSLIWAAADQKLTSNRYRPAFRSLVGFDMYRPLHFLGVAQTSVNMSPDVQLGDDETRMLSITARGPEPDIRNNGPHHFGMNTRLYGRKPTIKEAEKYGPYPIIVPEKEFIEQATTTSPSDEDVKKYRAQPFTDSAAVIDHFNKEVTVKIYKEAQKKILHLNHHNLDDSVMYLEELATIFNEKINAYYLGICRDDNIQPGALFTLDVGAK